MMLNQQVCTEKCDSCAIFGNSIFKELNHQERSILAANKKRITFSAGRAIVPSGKRTQTVYCIGRGIAKLQISTTTGRTHFLSVATAGDLPGALQMFLSGPQETELVAHEPLEACAIPLDIVRELSERNPHVQVELTSRLAQHMLFVRARLIAMMEKSASQRIADAILFLLGTFPQIKWTRRDFAEWAGTSVENVIRTMALFERRGLIRRQKGEISVEERRELEAFAK